jgi:hypothetical protein
MMLVEFVLWISPSRIPTQVLQWQHDHLTQKYQTFVILPHLMEHQPLG